MPITTGKFPAKINSFNCSQHNSNFPERAYHSKKGRRFSIAAFLLLITAFLASACESPGTVGDGIISGEEPVESRTFFIEDYSVLEENSFSGRLANTAIGYFEDPLYGTMKSIALLKPSISTANVDTILANDTISLRLIFSDFVYGDSLATSGFEIFEVGEIWRGAELRYNSSEIPVDMANKVAEFQVTANEDTVIVDLSNTWKNSFAEYFNSDTTLTAAQRDSIYINNFRGLAIVPSENNRNIRFLKTIETDDEDDDELITSFLLHSSEQDEDDEDEEDGPEIINLRDWGISFTRQMEPDHSDGIVLHNSERALKIQVDLPVEELVSKNIVNAQLIFSKNDNPLQNTPGISRPNANVIRAHVFEKEPQDIMAEIFTTDARFAASLDDTSNAFMMNITPYVLNGVFGDINNRIIYVTVQSINGVFYTSHFFDPSAADARKPRLVITYVEE